MEFGNSSRMTLQDAEWREFLETGLPITVFMIVLSITGTIGNAMVIVTVRRHSRPSNYRILIQCMAFVDFLCCTVSIPGYILVTRYRYTFTLTSDLLCRVPTVFHIFVAVSSVDLLRFIAIERYRKTCKPFGKQFTLRQIKIICACVVGFSVILSSLSVFAFRAQNIPTKYGNLTGRICSLDSEKTFPKVYTKLLISTLLISAIICTILYSIVGRTIMLQNRRRPKAISFRYRSARSAESSCYDSDRDVCRMSSSTGSVNQTGSLTSELITDGLRSVNQHRPLKGSSLYSKSAQISCMFLVCTFLSYLSFVPVLVIRCIESFDWSLRMKIFETLGPSAEILYRFHVVNHVINPIVYCLTNSNFRNDCARLCKCQKCR